MGLVGGLVPLPASVGVPQRMLIESNGFGCRVIFKSDYGQLHTSCSMLRLVVGERLASGAVFAGVVAVADARVGGGERSFRVEL